MTAIDTSSVIEIDRAPQQMVALLVASLIGITLSAGLILYDESLAFVMAAVFAGAGLAALWRMRGLRSTIVTITPEGIRDIRVSEKFIPWSVVQGVSIWNAAREKLGPFHVNVTGSFSGKNIVVLAINPDDLRRLALPQLLAWSRGLNRAAGMDGVCLTADRLKTDVSTLLAACTAYADAAKMTGRPGNPA